MKKKTLNISVLFEMSKELIYIVIVVVMPLMHLYI